MFSQLKITIVDQQNIIQAPIVPPPHIFHFPLCAFVLASVFVFFRAFAFLSYSIVLYQPVDVPILLNVCFCQTVLFSLLRLSSSFLLLLIISTYSFIILFYFSFLII